jgi:hypothetical protein
MMPNVITLLFKEARDTFPLIEGKPMDDNLQSIHEKLQHFPREVDNWEGLPSASCTWMAWKMAFRLAHVKRQQQILASGGGGASRQGSRCDPGGGAGNRAS